MYKYAVVIGRFQPFHLGHLKMLSKALKVGEQVVVVLGSARAARNTKNPWTAKEREEMIRSVLSPEDQARVHITHVRDYYYSDNLWVAEIQGRVREVIGDCRDVALVGCNKDSSSYYLKLFPQWKFEEHPAIGLLNATDIRAKLFSSSLVEMEWPEEQLAEHLQVPVGVAKYLHSFMDSRQFNELVLEYVFLKEYKELWSKSPYPPIFTTVDAVVIRSGHVLVVRRKAHPGRGLLALPGGFLNQEEKIIDGIVRELKEETGIRVPQKELRAHLGPIHTFDAPGRSLRGRTISHAGLIDLGYGDLPHVKGGDDAADAFWIPLFDAFSREEEFFEDHIHIVRAFTQK